MNRERPLRLRRLHVALVTAVATMATAAFAIPAVALDASVFELDGNATTDHAGTGPPDDWDRVCHQVLNADCSTTNNTNGAGAVEFASQSPDTGTTFTGGGSKDPIDISSWLWQQGTGGLPGKDILLNGFAARYSSPGSLNCPGSSISTPCNQVFFGMDRFDNSGDAQNGFWFFQNAITLTNNKSQGGSQFAGLHKNGDVLVVSDFSIGGSISTISVYVWDNTCTAAGKPIAACADANLQLLQSSSAANCSTAASNSAFCGIINIPIAPATTTPAPWAFTDKSGNSAFLNGEFYEGGIDLSDFPGLAGECFASTLAESRSSTSTSAVLKSFVLGSFGKCTSETATTPLDSGGNPITGPVSIGLGSVTVKDQAVVKVGGAASFGGTVTFFICGPLAASSTSNCQTGGVQLGAAKAVAPPSPVTVVSDPATLTEVGRYCWRAFYSGDQAQGVPPSTDPADSTSTTECLLVTPVTPTLTTSASGGGNIPATISDTATLTGTASAPGTNGIGADGSINATNAAPAGGSINFAAFGPDNCTSAVALTPSSLTVSGDKTYGPVSGTATAVGVYTFVASYASNSPNTNSVPATACPDPTGKERVTATDTSAASSQQTWVPNDTATVASGSGLTPLNGTLTIQLFEGAGCVSGNQVSGQLYTKTLTNATTLADRTLSTSNSTYSVSVTKSVSWLVTFSPTAGSNVSGSSHCENTSLTITN